jgi:hypothetical protein
LYFATRKYLKINNLPFIIILSSYLIAITLSIIGFVNDLNIMSMDIDTKNYLDELDFTVEIPEIIQDNQISNNKSLNNLFNKFFYLFDYNNNNQFWLMKTELKNTYYINNTRFTDFNRSGLLNVFEKYIEVSSVNQEILFFVDCFTDILDDLELIKNNLSKATI